MEPVESSPFIPLEYVPYAYGVLILWGLIDCFFGYRVFRLTLIFMFAIALSALGAWAGHYFQPGNSLWITVGFGAGFILGGVFSIFFYKIAVSALGALLGLALVTPWISGMDEWVQLLSLGMAAAVCAWLALLVVELMVKIATAVTGSLRIVYGVWFFLGGPPVLERMYQGEAIEPQVSASTPALVAFLALAVAGFAVQMRRSRRSKAE